MSAEWTKLSLNPGAKQPWVTIDASAPGLQILGCNKTFASLIIEGIPVSDNCPTGYDCLQWIVDAQQFKSWVADIASKKIPCKEPSTINATLRTPASCGFGSELRVTFSVLIEDRPAKSIDAIAAVGTGVDRSPGGAGALPLRLGVSRLRYRHMSRGHQQPKSTGAVRQLPNKRESTKILSAPAPSQKFKQPVISI